MMEQISSRGVPDGGAAPGSSHESEVLEEAVGTPLRARASRKIGTRRS